ncbi:MAG: arginine--tRNA ligase [Thermoanaerobaculales bacterium]|jgi:arginyl-tRNA synthetase|nr:arginine--tRNA ligase [Thermoanaerobaculales bacterium]
MPLNDIRDRAAAALAAALEAELGHRPDEVVLEVPPRRDLGDLAWPGALPLARVLKRAPRQIAETVAAQAVWPPEVRKVEVAGPGFLNLWLDRTEVLGRLLRGEHGGVFGSAVKTVVEHTNINPNKAAHIGHLRNAVLGDVLVRCLAGLGLEVEVQNYVDDTGVQVADVVVGLLHLPETDLADCLGDEPVRRDELIERAIALDSGGVPDAATDDFDDFCWALYPRVTARYAEDDAFREHRAEVLHAVEAGPGGLDLEQSLALLRGAVIGGDPWPQRAVAGLAAAVADANLRCHLATMARLGIGYDLLPHESDILRLGFWRRAFDLLRESGAIRLEAEGKNAGCWVMSLAASPEFADMDDPDKILVRSNGTVTYTGKDIAYQLWKLGLLVDADGARFDFGYRRYADWRQDGPAEPVRYVGGGEGRCLASTTAAPEQRLEGRSFGAAGRVYNVIDVRQAYPQRVVKEAVRVLGHPEAADSSVHFAYEMVALTPAAVRVIEQRSGTSFGLSDDEMAKPYVEMSGRRGIGVRADEFLDVLVDAAEDAIVGRLDGAGEPADIAERARAIAVGALRYLMARQSRNRVLAFDFDEALAFEGDTGPYLQYSAVRAAKIFDKLEARRGEGRFSADELPSLAGLEVPDDLWGLVLECARRRDVVAQAVGSLEFSLLAQHTHGLAQLFHRLYHAHPVVPEDDAALRALRRAVFTVFVGEMRVLLEELLGIPIPGEM